MLLFSLKNWPLIYSRPYGSFSKISFVILTIRMTCISSLPPKMVTNFFVFIRNQLFHDGTLTFDVTFTAKIDLMLIRSTNVTFRNNFDTDNIGMLPKNFNDSCTGSLITFRINRNNTNHCNFDDNKTLTSTY